MNDLKNYTLIQMTTVLESIYEEPKRPYSIKELELMKLNNYKSLKIGDIKVHNKKCNHFYNLKKYGRKERQIVENPDFEFESCSVCWKLKKTPTNLKDKAYNLVNEYIYQFSKDDKEISFFTNDLEYSFYKWLYTEFS